MRCWQNVMAYWALLMKPINKSFINLNRSGFQMSPIFLKLVWKSRHISRTLKEFWIICFWRKFISLADQIFMNDRMCAYVNFNQGFSTSRHCHWKPIESLATPEFSTHWCHARTKIPKLLTLFALSLSAYKFHWVTHAHGSHSLMSKK